MPKAAKPLPGPFTKAVVKQLAVAMTEHDFMTKSELARRANLGRTTVSDIVRGLQIPDLEQLDALCIALELPIVRVIKNAEAESESRRFDG